jgi:hypothetical protein
MLEETAAMKRANPRKLLVSVDWLDTAGAASWSGRSDFNLMACRSIGWLLRVTKQRVVIAAACNADGQWADRTAIPVNVVTRVAVLKEAETMPGTKWKQSLKRPAKYEALRKQGLSKESAARISNAKPKPSKGK